MAPVLTDPLLVGLVEIVASREIVQRALVPFAKRGFGNANAFVAKWFDVCWTVKFAGLTGTFEPCNEVQPEGKSNYGNYAQNFRPHHAHQAPSLA